MELLTTLLFFYYSMIFCFGGGSQFIDSPRRFVLYFVYDVLYSFYFSMLSFFFCFFLIIGLSSEQRFFVDQLYLSIFYEIFSYYLSMSAAVVLRYFLSVLRNLLFYILCFCNLAGFFFHNVVISLINYLSNFIDIQGKDILLFDLAFLYSLLHSIILTLFILFLGLFVLCLLSSISTLLKFYVYLLICLLRELLLKGYQLFQLGYLLSN